MSTSPILHRIRRQFTVMTMFVVVGLTCASSQARLINWGNAVDDTLYQSDGTTTLDGSFTMALGFFDSFTPTTNNVKSWEDNWKTYDNTTTTPGGFNPSLGFYTGGANLDASQHSDSPDADGTTVFAVGQQAHVWVYDSLALDPSDQWALYTNPDWTFPSGSSTHGTPIEWRLSDSGTVAVLGGLDSGGSVGDDPDLSHTAPSGSYDLQVFTLASAVPEPSGSLLSLLTMAGILSSRRRPRAA